MYAQDKKEKALEWYDQGISPTEIVRKLGCPKTRITIYLWIKQRKTTRSTPRNRIKVNNSPQHPLHPSAEVKLEIIKRCFARGENVKLVSEETGYSRSSIYKWRRNYIDKGNLSLMKKKDDIQRKEISSKNIADDELSSLKAQINDMQLEIDLLKETINVLKKDRGVDLTSLKNREKTAMIDAMKNKYPLSILLKRLALSKSSYYYQKSVPAGKDKYPAVRERIKELFVDNRSCYGYRRIHALLKKDGRTVSEKIVRKIMKEEDLTMGAKKRKKYSSYQGEISLPVENIIDRDFHAQGPNEKWLTDITEFAISAGKVYLSPIVDCFDGYLMSWTIGVSPDASLVNGMLDEAASRMPPGSHPIVHTDRGCHYRWPGWIQKMEEYGLERSMSKKGCSPDNAACEGLFGRLKNEMFYHQTWTGIRIDEFINILNDYLLWYNNDRIKQSLGFMSPRDYRQSLGIAV
jgi:transposase InsO family protein/transposase-like protein